MIVYFDGRGRNIETGQLYFNVNFMISLFCMKIFVHVLVLFDFKVEVALQYSTANIDE